MKLFHRLRVSMAANIIGAIVIVLSLFGIVVSTIGFVSFTRAFEKEYSETTAHMADTAAAMVNGDSIDMYLSGRKAMEYVMTRADLDDYCKKMSVSLVYIIKVDRTDYGRFVSVFNSVNNSVDDTEYVEWELGHKRDTTNDEYRRKYRSIYEQKSASETVYRTNTTDGVHPHITTMVPVKNSTGSVAAILCIQRPMRELYDARRPYLITVAVSTLLLALASSVFAAFYIRKQVVLPLRRLSAEATRFSKENTRGETLERVSRFEELSGLATSIDTMEGEMVSYIDNLTAVTAEKERIGAELSVARTIQENSIPNIFPPFPGRREFDIFAVMDPAKEVGGDFYNFFLIDDDHLALTIGDVSGKGVPAALFMMVTNILISDRTKAGGTPASILTSINADICRRNKAEMFVTVWLGILEISTGRVTAANAGHEYPVIRRPGGRFELLKDRHGFVVGGMDGICYKDYDFTLEPGASLFIYTDGVPEATDADSRMFGVERMLTALNRDPQAGAEEMLRAVRRDVDGFVKDATQFDDLTMLGLTFRGKPGEEKQPEE